MMRHLNRVESPGPRTRVRLLALRLLALAVLLLGVNYLVWRWTASLNWDAWWIALPLVLAETYTFVDVALFAVTVSNARTRSLPNPAPPGLSVDVFITTYNEPVDLVMATARAAQRIRYPHNTWILDDGSRLEMELAARNQGIGYITRGPEWAGRPRHAKAGNLNNALVRTHGEFILILDADQVPAPEILDNSLGYFNDRRVALVQTPQYFANVPAHDPFGSQAPLFYGPIQQGKDAWNAAYFCGSNAILRREALMQLGLARYVKETERRLVRALKAAKSVIRRARRRPEARNPIVARLLAEVGHAMVAARSDLRAGATFAEVTYRVQERVSAAEAAGAADHMSMRSSDRDAVASLGADLPVDFDDEELDTAVLRLTRR